MPVSAEPLARRLPPSAEKLSVEEVMLQRRIATVKGNPDTRAGRSMISSKLPPEHITRRATQSASASEIMRRKHQFQRSSSSSSGGGGSGGVGGIPRRGAEAAYSRGHLTLRPLTGTRPPQMQTQAMDYSGEFGGGNQQQQQSYFFEGDPLANVAAHQRSGQLLERRSMTAGSSKAYMSQSVPAFPFGLFSGEADDGMAASSGGGGGGGGVGDAQSSAKVAAIVAKCNLLAERLAAVEQELTETKRREQENMIAQQAEQQRQQTQLLLQTQQATAAGAGTTATTTTEGVGGDETAAATAMVEGSGGTATVAAPGVVADGTAAAAATSNNNNDGGGGGGGGDAYNENQNAPSTHPKRKVDLTGKTRLDYQMEGVKDKLGQLHDVFHASANEETVRDEAGRTLQRVVRRAIMRRRYRGFKLAIIDWRRAHSRELLQVAARELERQQKITQKVAQLKLMREMKMLQWIFGAWEKDMRGSQQLRHHIKEAVQVMEGNQNVRWQKLVVRAWRSVVVGPSSRRSCRERHAARLAAARQSLVDRLGGDGSGVVTGEMVREEMTRRLHNEMVERRRFHCLKQHFAALAAAAAARREKEQMAERHHSQGVLSAIFFPWTEWTYAHSRGLDRKQWKGPRRFEVAYNRKKVDAFTRKILLRKLLPAWAAVSKRYGASRRLGRRAFSRFVRRNLLAWREVSVRHLSLIRGAVEQWREKGRSFYELPFRAWFLFMDKRRKEKADNDRLIMQHTRLKTRQLLWKIMRTWRHQAVFGRVEGLYSRTELMRSLAEQKTHCKGLEVQAREFTAAMQESHRLLEEEHAQVKTLEAKLEGREKEVESLQMAMHHAEQEVVRMRGVVDAVAQLHPAVTKHLVELQPRFGFVEGRFALHDLAGTRAENEANDLLEDARDEAEEWMEENEDAFNAAQAKEAEEGIGALSDEEKATLELGNKHEEAIRAADEADAKAAEKEANATLAPIDNATAANRSAAATAGALSPTKAANATATMAAATPTTTTTTTTTTAAMASPGKERPRAATFSGGANSPGGLPGGVGISNPKSPGGVDGSGGGAGSPNRRMSTRRMSRMQGMGGLPGMGGTGGVDKTQLPPMTELERDGLTRLQFALKHCNFKDVTEVNGEDLYSEYDGFQRPKSEEEVAEEEAAAKRRAKAAKIASEEGGTTSLLTDEQQAFTATTTMTNTALSAASPMGGEGEGGEALLPKSAEEAVAAAVAKHMDNNEALRQDLVAVHGIVEFLRSGNASCLPPRQQAAWARENPGNGGNALAMAGLAGRNWGSLTAATSMVKDGSRTWNDFLLQMNSKLPSTRKTSTVQEKLSRRIVDSYDRAESTATALYGGADPTTLQVNPYATAPIDDDFRPGTPDEWQTGPVPGDDALFIERAHQFGSPLKFATMMGSSAASSTQQLSTTMGASSSMMGGTLLGAPITEGVATEHHAGTTASMAHTTGSFPGSLF